LFLSEVKPCIEPAEEDTEHKNEFSGKFDIDELFHVVDDKRAGIRQGRIMSFPQPDLEVGKRTIPVKYLEDHRKDKPGDMSDLHLLVSYAEECPEEQKDNPEEMDKDNTVGKDLV